MVNRPDVTVEEFFAILPQLEELDFLRLRLVAAAVPDPRRQWDSSSEYATFDKRIVTLEAAEHAIQESEDGLKQLISAIHSDLRALLSSFWSSDVPGAVALLVEIGERLEQGGRAEKACSCYRAALSLALPLTDKRPQMLALRRVARVLVGIGDFSEALSYYERSAQLARDSGDVRSEIVGRTGIGNVRFWQGRLADAERCYLEALGLAQQAAADEEFALEQGQLFNNLGNICSRQGRLAEAEEWIARSHGVWERVVSTQDLAISHSNLAHVRVAQGRRPEAVRLYEQALALPVSPEYSALVSTDLANVYVEEGRLGEAARWGRIAEEHAIAARSPYALGFMYHGRGRVSLARKHEDAFVFFEKALQIAREKGLVFLEAETLLDYARLRMRNGGREEAHAYLEHAREIFVQLGAVRLQAEAEELLAEIGDQPPMPAAAD